MIFQLFTAMSLIASQYNKQNACQHSTHKKTRYLVEKRISNDESDKDKPLRADNISQKYIVGWDKHLSN